MGESPSLAEVTRAIAVDASYREALTQQIATRSVNVELLNQLIAYARSRQATLGTAMARRILTEAGVSWEAL